MPFSPVPKKTFRLPSIYLVPVLAAAALMAVNINAPMGDPDFYWHLAAGRWVLGHGQIPAADPFSFSCAGRPWVAHEWLFETALALADRALGYTGAVLLGHAFFWVFAGLFYRWLKTLSPSSLLAAGALLLPAAVTLFPFWTLRPQIASYTFFVAFLAALQSGAPRGGRLLALAALTAVWANTHGSFVLAPLLVLYRALCEFLSHLMEEIKVTGRPLPAAALASAKTAAKNWGAAFTVIAAAGALNPWGFSHYLYPLVIATDTVMKSAIVEWHSPNFHQPYARYLLFAWLLAFICRPLWPKAAKIRMTLFWACVLFTWLTLTSVRYAPYWVILLCGYLLPADCPKTKGEDSFALKGAQGGAKSGRTRQVKVWQAATLWLLALAFAGAAMLGRLPRGPVEANVSPAFPQAAAEKLAGGPPGTRLLNHYNWGGYLIWRLGPKLPVFIDGRADLYAGEVFNQYLSLMKLKDAQALLDYWQFDLVLMPPDEPLVSWLRLNPAWETWYEDEKAVIMKKAKGS